MSKVALTSIGAAGIATSVPLMHMLGNKKTKMVDMATMGLFVVGWVLFGLGVAKVPEELDDTVGEEWKKRQTGLVAAGILLVVGGIAALRYGTSIKIPVLVGAIAFVAGWGCITGAVVHSNPDFEDMGKEEQVGRMLQSTAASLDVIFGVALISMSTSLISAQGGMVPLSRTTLQIAAVTTFVLGWIQLVSLSALQ